MSHKTDFVRKALSIPFVLLVLLVGCDKDDDNNSTTSTTISDAVVSSSEFSTLETAVIKANLQSTLSGAGPFTVFAPDNSGFDKSGISAATLNSLTQQQVAGILLYHTLGSKVIAADVPAGPNAIVITAGGDSVFVTKNGAGVFVNGVKVEQADINASNGVIHRVGRVLLPPVGNLVAAAQAPGSGLDSLVKAVLRANNTPGGDPTLVATLQTSRLTLFAPNNAAFTQLLSTLSLTDINDIPIPTLLAVLRYHLVPGRAFSSDLSNGSVTMLANGNTTVNLTNGTNGAPTITGNGNGGNGSNIVATDVVARNGVVHVIDRVLLP
jgi:uncharacterized surface protein with fasciclin (FAS1) repeats